MARKSNKKTRGVTMKRQGQAPRKKKKDSLDFLADVASSIVKHDKKSEKAAKKLEAKKAQTLSVKSEKAAKKLQSKKAPAVKIVSVTRLNDKGGLQRNKELDKLRLVLRIAQYKEGPWKGLWDIEAKGKATVPQTKRTFDKIYELIHEAEVSLCKSSTVGIESPHVCEIGYAGQDDHGHPWFQSTINGETKHVKTILIHNERIVEIWKALVTKKADPTKMNKTLNKIMLKTGFTQCVQPNKGTLFTFEDRCWLTNAPSLLKGGSGSGSALEKGRPYIVVI